MMGNNTMPGALGNEVMMRLDMLARRIDYLEHLVAQRGAMSFPVSHSDYGRGTGVGSPPVSDAAFGPAFGNIFPGPKG